MNILFCSGDYYPSLGGATSVVDDLARELIRNGHTAVVLTRQWAGLSDFEERQGYEIHRVDYPLPFEKFEWSRRIFLESIPILLRIWRLLRKRKIDTVCISLLDMSAWYLMILQPFVGFRLVLYLHGGEARWLCDEEPSYRTLFKASLQRSDAVIAVSEDLRQEAALAVPGTEGKTTTIANAVNLANLRQVEGLRHPRRYIAAVGRLVREKDFPTLIRAYGLIQEQVPDVDLIIAGGGRELANLQQAAQDCARPERVVFLGQVERELAMATIKGGMFLVLSSTTEGFPIVAIEALAMGKPIIGTSIPGIRAVVQDGFDGDLFPVGNVEAFAKLLQRYCSDSDLLSQRREGARQVNLDRYDMGKVIERHLAVYRGKP